MFYNFPMPDEPTTKHPTGPTDPVESIQDPTPNAQNTPVETSSTPTSTPVSPDDEKTRLERIYDLFVFWFSVPEVDRRPATLDLFCEKHNVTMATLKEFMNRPGFHELLEQRAVLWAKGKIPGILHQLHKRIVDSGSPTDIRQFLEFVREYSKKPDQKTTLVVINPTEKQYEQIVKREAELLSSGSSPLAT